MTRLGTGLVAVSFASMALMGWMPAGAQLWLLVACAIGFDLGVQAALIAHQSIIYGLDPAARSRLNAVLFTGMFIGMALGSALAAQLFAHWGWMAVTALATLSALGSFILRMRR